MALNPFTIVNHLIDGGVAPSQAKFHPGKQGGWSFDFRFGKRLRRVRFRPEENQFVVLERKFLRYRNVATIPLTGDETNQQAASLILNVG
jgi:hypothetical protein